jgi:phosphatidylglycerophosphatase A
MNDPHDILDADPERKAERDSQRDAQLRRRFGGRFGYFRNRQGTDEGDGAPGSPPTGPGSSGGSNPGGPTRNVRPTAEFMRSHPAHLLSLGFGTGLSRLMPGTVGTVFGWISFLVLNQYLTSAGWIALIIVGFVVGIWATDFTARRLGVSDPGAINWDEIVAFWLVMLFVTPATWSGQLFAFIVFRLFDMVKPPPIRWFDRNCKGGLGIMIDDIVAAFMTLLVIALVRTYYGH